MTPETSDAANLPLTLAEVIAAAVHTSSVGVTIAGPTGESLYANPAAVQHKGLGSQAGVPLIDTSHHAIDVRGRTFAIHMTHDASAHRLAEEELTRRAFFDDLTGLPKRDLFEQTVKGMIDETCQPFALAFIDIDNFKNVNDYYGHAVGDQLLVKIVQRVTDAMRATDLLARVGGDEFVLLATPLDTVDGSCALIERLATRLREPFFIDGYEIFSSASIGVSLYPNHGHDYMVLRANADSAMYRVKASTKGGVGVYDAGLGHDAAERMEVEQRVRLAIRDKRLLCAYQPKVDFRSDKIVGVEVLLRWQDANGDIKAPGDFVKIAIELGLMDSIAVAVVDQVVAQIDLINDAFGVDCSISLNVAAKQATDLVFMSSLIATLAATGFAHRFTLELTEEAFLSKGDFQSKILPMIREIGARVSIDDFGVGYSSLSMLAEITADELKVDRSFITDIHQKPRNQSILKMIELLGSALGMNIVVEGVENADELTYLMAATRINCAQGYYFAKPMILQMAPEPVAAAGRRDAHAAREVFPQRSVAR